MVNKILENIFFLIATYHLLLKSISRIISTNLYLFYIDEEVMKLFTLETISFRSSILAYIFTCNQRGIQYAENTAADFCYKSNNCNDNSGEYSRYEKACVRSLFLFY